YTFFSLHLEKLGYDTAMIGMLWSLGVAAEVLLFMRVSDLFLRFSLRRILLASLAITALRWFLIAKFSDHLLILLLAQLMHAASFGSFHAVAIEYVRRFFRSGNHGRGQAFYSSVSFGAGGATGALMAGFFLSISPAASFIAAAVAAIVAILIVAYWIKEDNLV
ncbi:MAG: MFS transporter, partial [Pseudomonadales bacterium]